MTIAVDVDTIARLRTCLIQISRRIDRQASAGGLTSTEASVLAAIANRGPIGLGELAASQGINRTMLSRVVKKLQAADLIRRQSSSTDRRAFEVVATPQGARLRERLLAARSRLLAERLAELSGDTTAIILEALPALEELAAVLEPRPLHGRPVFRRRCLNPTVRRLLLRPGRGNSCGAWLTPPRGSSTVIPTS